MFLCFAIAIAILYFTRLLTGGFDQNSFLSFMIMIGLLGTHVYLTTRKKAVFGIIVPIFLVLSFYPVCKMTNPSKSQFIILSCFYIIALVCFLYICYKAREDYKK